MPADPSTLKYRALLETSEAFIACRDYDTLLRTLWGSLQPVIPFDYLVLVRYDQGKHAGWLEAVAGPDDLGLPLRTDLPMEGTPTEILLASGEPLYVPDLRIETRFRRDVMERVERHGLLSGYWAPLSRGGKHLGLTRDSPLDRWMPTALEDRELMDHIARQVTIAVENALAFENP